MTGQVSCSASPRYSVDTTGEIWDGKQGIGIAEASRRLNAHCQFAEQMLATMQALHPNAAGDMTNQGYADLWNATLDRLEAIVMEGETP